MATKKSMLIFGIVAVVVVVAGIAIGMIVSSLGKQQPVADTNPTATDMTATLEAAIDIQDHSYKPAAIKVKKGTKVTWTNRDNVGHNVVAEAAPDTGGIPESAPLLGRGQTFSVTFNRVGTFHYYCTPHTFMRGSVEVVD